MHKNCVGDSIVVRLSGNLLAAVGNETFSHSPIFLSFLPFSYIDRGWIILKNR